MHLGDFTLMQKQLARSALFVAERHFALIFRDISVDQPHFAVLRFGIGFLNISLAIAQRFNFGTAQGDAGFKRFRQEKVKAGPPVLRDNLVVTCFFLGCHKTLVIAYWPRIPAFLSAASTLRLDSSAISTIGKRIWLPHRPRSSAAYFTGPGLDSQNIAL